MFAIFKKFIKLYAVLSLGLLIVAGWFLYSWNKSHQDLVAARQQTLVAQFTDTITRDLHSNASDARFLARLVGRYIEHGHSGLHALEDFFADFSRSRDFYFSLRYIDETGAERVRIDRSYAGPVITPPSVLQNKGDRYYFRETSKLKRNDVYVSNFDLNVEHGKIEIPYRPTLRFAAPVVDRDGESLGIVVLNYEGRALLNSIRLQAGLGEGIILLSSSEGYWILGPTSEEEWGQLVKERAKHTMASRFPEAWKRMTEVNKSQIRTGAGLFTFDAVGVAPGTVLNEDSIMDGDYSKRWRILTWVPDNRLRVPWMSFYLVLGGIFLGLLAMGCWQVADNLVHQEEVELLLRENEERTMAISQSSQDAIVMIDSKGLVIHWNPAAEQLFGYSESQVMGFSLHDLLAPEDLRDKAHKGLLDFAATGEGRIIDSVMDFTGIHKNGDLVPVELAASSFKFKDEWYAVGTMRDTSRRRKSELELKRSEETSRALINAPTESAMLISLNGTIEAINEIGAQRMDGTVDDLIGKNAFDRIDKDFVKQGREIAFRVQQTGEPVTFERVRGDRRMLINMYPVRGAEDSVDRLAIFVRDVTEQRMAEAALMYSEQRFRDVSEAVGEIIWETDKDGVLQFITDDIQSVLGYSPEEMQGRTMSVFLPEEDADDYEHWRKRVYGRRRSFSNTEARTVDKSGNQVWLQLSGAPYYDSEDNFQGFRGAALDITERRADEIAIKASERKLRALAESAYDAIVMVDAKGRVSFWNDSAEHLFGYTEEEVLGQDIHPLVAPPETHDDAAKGMEEFTKSGTGPAVGAITEMEAVHKDGTRFEVERSIASFRLSGEWYAVATIRDISERKATEAKLRELATTDSLTGLYNRRRFMELCEREFSRSVRYGRPLAMFMLDIDHFKKVNDEYGHDAGDQVLRSLSEISVLALRGADILGRLGGEEFGVLLPETEVKAAHDVAERLRQSIERAAISINGFTLNITVSVGVSILTPEMHTIDQLLKGADVALYQAKQSGRNKVVMG